MKKRKIFTKKLKKSGKKLKKILKKEVKILLIFQKNKKMIDKKNKK